MVIMSKNAILEGLLFISGEDGVSINQICEILNININDAKEVIDNLIKYYENNERGLNINLYGNKYVFTTKKEYSNYYEKLVKSKENNILSQASLETLAIIAYNEPITRVEIDEIRGVSSNHIVRKLISKNLICECGKSELPGKPILYKTTDFFLKYFGISNLSQLPSIDEIKVDDEELDLFNSTEVRRDEELEIIE